MVNHSFDASENSHFGVLILGGGGHAKVLIDALCSRRNDFRGAIADPNPDLKGKSVSGLLVIGGDEVLLASTEHHYTHFIVGVGANPKLRAELFAKAKGAGLSPITVTHENTILSPTAQIGSGSMVFAGAIINAGAVIAENVIVNTGVIVEHDCEIDAHAHIAPRACLLGGVRVGAEALIGAGAIVLEGREIGRGAIIGAGAVVTRNVAPGETAFGVPAEPRRPPRSMLRKAFLFNKLKFGGALPSLKPIVLKVWQSLLGKGRTLHEKGRCLLARGRSFLGRH